MPPQWYLRTPFLKTAVSRGKGFKPPRHFSSQINLADITSNSLRGRRMSSVPKKTIYLPYYPSAITHKMLRSLTGFLELFYEDRGMSNIQWDSKALRHFFYSPRALRGGSGQATQKFNESGVGWFHFLFASDGAGRRLVHEREGESEQKSVLAASPVHMLSAVPLCGEAADGCEVSLMLASRQSHHQGRGRDLKPRRT